MLAKMIRLNSIFSTILKGYPVNAVPVRAIDFEERQSSMYPATPFKLLLATVLQLGAMGNRVPLFCLLMRVPEISPLRSSIYHLVIEARVN